MKEIGLLKQESRNKHQIVGVRKTKIMLFPKGGKNEGNVSLKQTSRLNSDRYSHKEQRKAILYHESHRQKNIEKSPSRVRTTDCGGLVENSLKQIANSYHSDSLLYPFFCS
jgi:hypothetical protein